MPCSKKFASRGHVDGEHDPVAAPHVKRDTGFQECDWNILSARCQKFAQSQPTLARVSAWDLFRPAQQPSMTADNSVPHRRFRQGFMIVLSRRAQRCRGNRDGRNDGLRSRFGHWSARGGRSRTPRPGRVTVPSPIAATWTSSEGKFGIALPVATHDDPETVETQDAAARSDDGCARVLPT